MEMAGPIFGTAVAFISLVVSYAVQVLERNVAAAPEGFSH